MTDADAGHKMDGLWHARTRESQHFDRPKHVRWSERAIASDPVHVGRRVINSVDLRGELRECVRRQPQARQREIAFDDVEARLERLGPHAVPNEMLAQSPARVGTVPANETMNVRIA